MTLKNTLQEGIPLWVDRSVGLGKIVKRAIAVVCARETVRFTKYVELLALSCVSLENGVYRFIDHL